MEVLGADSSIVAEVEDIVADIVAVAVPGIAAQPDIGPGVPWWLQDNSASLHTLLVDYSTDSADRRLQDTVPADPDRLVAVGAVHLEVVD